jgi:two-component system chemotaxis response regulator CheB
VSAKPIRVMIVEDSQVVRQLLTHIVSQDRRLTVAAAVSSAEEALAEIGRVAPDVISMDIRLPGMNGLDATRRIMTEHPTPIVVVADAVEDDSLKISMNALRAGALSVVEKPTGTVSDGYADLAHTICTQLRIMSAVSVIRQRVPTRTATDTVERFPESSEIARPSIIGVGASTGGPPALAKFLGALPSNFPLPILLVQHMGAAFMEGFTNWLNAQTDLDVVLAQAGMLPEPGRVYVAPGDRHLVLGAGGIMRLTTDPLVGSQRPSVNVLFQSLAATAGAKALGILMTGMGEDGARGLAEMRLAGGYTITEDESTCVVYGMPAAAVRLGASRERLALDAIAPRVLRIVGTGKP